MIIPKDELDAPPEALHYGLFFKGRCYLYD